MNDEEYAKRGYLNENFRLFHIRDHTPSAMEYHYHEFDKIVFFMGGSVDYTIEGRKYMLKPRDILFVRHHLIHKLEIDPSVLYDRVVIYINPDYMKTLGDGVQPLDCCFSITAKRQFCLMRQTGNAVGEITNLLSSLENVSADAFGAEALSKALFTQLLIMLDRAVLSDTTHQNLSASTSDPKITVVLSYINENLGEDLSVDKLAEMIFMSKYHFMRRFRELTGETAHSYVLQKRLFKASELMRAGDSAGDAARHCGFVDYSSFHRAFKKQFGSTPREIRK